MCEALALAMRRYGVPEQILSDNGKVFTSRFGPGRGEVLFDRICRENGIRHLLTAPSSPTTTGKVERFHKTIRSEFLSGRSFSTLEEAQEALDAWVDSYNQDRPHQGIGMVPPQVRFALASFEAPEPVLPEEGSTEYFLEPGAQVRRVLRKVNDHGRISLLGFEYHVGRYLLGETVDVELGDDGLVSIFHRGVLVATHARRHLPDKEPASWQTRPRVRVIREKTPTITVTRKVDPTGSVSFAGTGYRVGNGYRGRSVEVLLAHDTVQIKLNGKILRTHAARHDKHKELGAFANPKGRPRRKKAS